MVFAEDGTRMGAISGGCVEKELYRKSQDVFKTGISKIVSYDGRYRLGCEGYLYILLEVFSPDDACVKMMNHMLETRNDLYFTSYYQEGTEISGSFGSVVTNGSLSFSLSNYTSEELKLKSLHLFDQKIKRSVRLIIFGYEHDAGTLCKLAALVGWDVIVVSSVQSNKTLPDFPGAHRLISTTAEMMDYTLIDEKTAVLLMNHNFAKDLTYLVQLSKFSPEYIGILGSVKRWNRLQDQLLEINAGIALEFLDSVHSPAGLDIGSETAEEISLAILSEIQAVFSKKEVSAITSLALKKAEQIV